MTLCHDRMIRWAKEKVHVYSDSVLCLGTIRHPSREKHQVERMDSVFRTTALSGNQIHPDPFTGRVLFMSMFNDIDWTKNENSSVSRMPGK